MKYLNKLDNLLLKDDVVYSFYNAYDNDIEFRDWLDELIPQVRQCELQKQNNPWHKYNVLEHILHSVEEMNKMTKGYNYNLRRLLAYTMFFHDIGKPDTHIVREKDGVMIDSFFSHNKKGCQIAKEILPKLNFTQEEINIILAFIYKHDIFMYIRETRQPGYKCLDSKLVEKEINDLNKVGNGKELIKYLVMISRADNLSQNELMTGNALKLLDKFDSLINDVRIVK